MASTSPTPTINSTVSTNSTDVLPVVLRNILIITASVAVLLLIIMYLIFRYCCRCCKRKQTPAKTYESTDTNMEYHGYDEIKYSECKENIHEENERMSRSLSNLDLDLDTSSYLIARPPSYQLPPPPKETRSLDRNVEISSVDTIPKGVSVKIKDGRWHKTIDIKFD